MFDEVPLDRFAAFHDEFQGDTWDACERCGGQCEFNKIGSLIPGEAEFIARNLNTDPGEFREKYLDGIETPFGVVDVLKIKPGCPFLSPSFKCTIRDVKVVLCEVYPVVFTATEDEVCFSLDDWCPITRHRPALAEVFVEKAIPALERLRAPLHWFRAVALYDHLCVDYHRLFELRRHDLGYTTLPLEALESCQAPEAPPPEFAPL